MEIKEFKEEELQKLFKPRKDSSKEDNGQITIIGGSELFHGAPIFALKTASRIVDMVFFSSPELSIKGVAEKMKSELSSFIWVPFEEIEEYIKKADAILIGPGLLRYHREGGEEYDEAGEESKEITETLMKKFPNKQWVIDAGSLQVMEAKYIPPKAILTPNEKELRLLFGAEVGSQPSPRQFLDIAKKYSCIIVLKNIETFICSSKEGVVVKGGNAGLTKGGTGDVLAGLAVALVAKNPPFLSACAAAFLTKKAGDELYKKVGFAYNADDLAEEIPRVLGEYWR
jgi:NAD(P)H-hydrate epimerase